MMNKDNLNFQNNGFDIGLFNDMLHHVDIDKQILLIKEGLRVCSELLIFEVKPTIFSKLGDYVMNYFHNKDMPLPLTHRSLEDWMKLFKDNNMSVKYYKVNRSLFYPVTNYLFHLKQKK